MGKKKEVEEMRGGGKMCPEQREGGRVQVKSDWMKADGSQGMFRLYDKTK